MLSIEDYAFIHRTDQISPTDPRMVNIWKALRQAVDGNKLWTKAFYLLAALAYDMEREDVDMMVNLPIVIDQVKPDDPRLAKFWADGTAAAERTDMCDVFDQITDTMTGRVRKSAMENGFHQQVH